MKKIILTVFAATSLLLYSTQAFALLSVSVGMPMGHTITDKTIHLAGYDAPSGYLIGVQLPFAVGLGMDSYKTKLKESEAKLGTDMYNIFYQLPIPVINLIIGLGTGNQALECDGCADAFDKGSATQWYTSIGFPILPLFDIHLSYRSITSKNINIKESDTKLDFSGSVTGVGFAFNF
jgi:hypothetical protein